MSSSVPLKTPCAPIIPSKHTPPTSKKKHSSQIQSPPTQPNPAPTQNPSTPLITQPSRSHLHQKSLAHLAKAVYKTNKKWEKRPHQRRSERPYIIRQAMISLAGPFPPRHGDWSRLSARVLQSLARPAADRPRFARVTRAARADKSPANSLSAPRLHI